MSKNVIYKTPNRKTPNIDNVFGTDVKHPLQVNARGGIAIVAGKDTVKQGINDLVEVDENECAYAEKMGAGAYRYLDKELTETIAKKLAYRVWQNLEQYEHRAKNFRVTGKHEPKGVDNPSSKVIISVSLEFLGYQRGENLVIPVNLERQK